MAKTRTGLRCAFVVWLLCAGLLAACGEEPTPTPPPPPTPRPTPTLSAERVLENALFAITFNDVLIGVEELHTGASDDQMVVFSEARLELGLPFTERRSAVVSSTLSPLRYDLERNVLGVRSTWSGERRSGAMDCLNNNAEWVAPVLFEGVAPPPEVMLESFPSALPYVLLALRYTAPREEGQGDMLRLSALDITEDHPISRDLTLARSADRAGSVIGTVALEGRVEGALNPAFSMWIRASSRSLFSVEVPDYRFGFWDQRGHPSLRQTGTLVIKRVAALPDLEASVQPGDAQGAPLGFAAQDGTALAGTLALPDGQGPFPCVLVHGPGGARSRLDLSASLLSHGWAVYSYDQRGVGESKGDYARGGPITLGRDLAAAARMLAERAEIDPGRIVLLGLGEGGHASAVALAQAAPVAGAILGSCASPEPLFPGLVTYRVDAVLAAHYQWDGRQAAKYHDLSAEAWQVWLFEGQDQVSLLRRRIGVRNLEELSNTDLSMLLADVSVPILLLHGGQDAWTPLSGAQALERALEGAGRAVELQVFADLGAELSMDGDERALAPEVVAAISTWLEQF